MGPGAVPTNDPGPSFDASVFLSALARLTGALDAANQPLVFDTAVPLEDLRDAIVEAITETATLPVDITLAASGLPAGLTFDLAPPVVADVAPGGTAYIAATLTGDGSAINGAFDINFLDDDSGAVLGSIPVDIACEGGGGPTPPGPQPIPAISTLGVVALASGLGLLGMRRVRRKR